MFFELRWFGIYIHVSAVVITFVLHLLHVGRKSFINNDGGI